MDFYYLKLKEGRYVTVRNSERGKCLCAEDKQAVARAQVSIYISTESDKLMAFYIRHGNDNYSIKVNGTRLELEKVASYDKSNLHWFERIHHGNGTFYCLRSVGKENGYLSISGKYLSISSDSQSPVYIRHERKP